jgi:hypothetical protein
MHGPIKRKLHYLEKRVRYLIKGKVFITEKHFTPKALRRQSVRAGTLIKTPSFKLRNRYQVLPGNRADSCSDRYIIHADINDIYSGIGCNMSLLPFCWNYALKTNRTLIIDWRGNPYTKNSPRENLFSILFAPPDPAMLGVQCIADESVNQLRFPQPILGPRDSISQEWRKERLPNGGLHQDLFTEIIRRNIDVPHPTILPSLRVLWPLLDGHRDLDFSTLRYFYKCLRLKHEWWQIVIDFYKEHMDRKPVIGVHLRHGNGEEKFTSDFSNRVIENVDAFIRDVAERIRRHGAGKYPSGFDILLCTDSPLVCEAFKRFFPDVITRAQWRPKTGEGTSFDQSYNHPLGPEATAVDAIVDMYLLSFCDTAILTRETKFAYFIRYIMQKDHALFIDWKEFFNQLSPASPAQESVKNW